ncbi:lysozyme inhibitor LprI family protein [Paraburkholderia antibiotica]|uniref:DUF1311 domain-containing protein n=1 Tax=Paraburkholderia antibiotica TaxID=2728839 RepID=A0A7X9X209_9BURK|nr:lysozyme inhibitor LprI family protein [Paraburkholderia antibiotica]NML29809.1 DUF1311 domain-containing protein [Paraburkholderia antibiotica]
MRAISISLLFLIFAPWVAAQSIYGEAFDYKKAEPTSKYFAGKTAAQINALCKHDSLPTADLSACAQYEFENADSALRKRLSEVQADTHSAHHLRRGAGEPDPLPYFNRAQDNWARYRDNECYFEVYEVGPASLRFAEFWDCMTRITKLRIKDLSSATADTR